MAGSWQEQTGRRLCKQRRSDRERSDRGRRPPPVRPLAGWNNCRGWGLITATSRVTSLLRSGRSFKAAARLVNGSGVRIVSGRGSRAACRATAPGGILSWGAASSAQPRKMAGTGLPSCTSVEERAGLRTATITPEAFPKRVDIPTLLPLRASIQGIARQASGSVRAVALLAASGSIRILSGRAICGPPRIGTSGVCGSLSSSSRIVRRLWKSEDGNRRAGQMFRRSSNTL